MSERPTPITDRMQIAYRKAWSERNEKGAVDELIISHADLERQLAEAREEIGRIRKFATVNGVVELERQLAESKSQLAIADEQLALERGALAEAREQRDALAEECEWMRALIETIRDKADLRFNGNRGLCAFSDLKEAALAAVKEATLEQP